MRPPEAKWIYRVLSEHSCSPLLNLGSSTGAFREIAKPHIEAELFAPLRRGGVKVLHADIKSAPGVDLVGDILDPAYVAQLKTYDFRAILVSNLLEHVTDPASVARSCREIVKPGGMICVTGPHQFPFHADPIDTMYRPSPQGFADLFGGKLVESLVIEDGTMLDELKMPLPRYLLQSAWRIANIVRNPVAARERISRLSYAFRPYMISCALIET